MIEKIVGGIILGLLTYIGKTLWQNRRHLTLLRVLLAPGRRTRVSVAVLLRVQDEDFHVLFDSPTRPGGFGPPGGVVKYHDSAQRTLERLGFTPDGRTRDVMKRDLRGFLTAARVLGFARWLYGGVDREPATDALRRELAEELAETGHGELAPLSRAVNFRLVRRVIDGPLKVPGEDYRQIRFFEVHDLVLDTPEATELRTVLLTLAADQDEAHIIGATRQEIARGRAGVHVILPQSAFLVGDRRLREDIQPVQ
ncbi:hypothetical protein ACFPM3_10150 [Streptomyces coeruleoprunus]|uniref:CD-NTase-associated protein 16 NUDIX domain-containing protein n=1 Tax=Streptomyces coeruleoprunus TaxID=285563 RepID=A0ABV9XFX5_9ACTN